MRAQASHTRSGARAADAIDPMPPLRTFSSAAGVTVFSSLVIVFCEEGVAVSAVFLKRRYGWLRRLAAWLVGRLVTFVRLLVAALARVSLAR